MYVETTRPELVPAVVALIAHPDDERYQPLFGTTVRSPLFDVEIPVLAHPLAEMDKGAGIAMCCTFGDLTDVTWWRELQLPTRAVVGRDGRILRDVPDWITSAAGRELYGKLAADDVLGPRGHRGGAARQRRPGRRADATLRMANFYEKGDKPLEIVTSRQWYIRNGGRDEHLKDASSSAVDELDFVPEFMAHRYENWVSGLNGDWLISRQRFFGVPFPVWYRLDAAGEIRTTTRSCPTRRHCRSIRRPTRRPGWTTTSATSPVASSATRT